MTKKETKTESNSSLETFTILPIDEDRGPMTVEEKRNARLYTEGGFTIDFSKMFASK